MDLADRIRVVNLYTRQDNDLEICGHQLEVLDDAGRWVVVPLVERVLGTNEQVIWSNGKPWPASAVNGRTKS